MRASRKANIRNGDRTNVQVHWHDTIKKFLPNFIRTRIHDACCSRVLRRASNTHPTSNSSWWPQILKKVAERKIIQMKTQRPSSFRHVLKPCPSDLAHILGRSSFKFQNLRDRYHLWKYPSRELLTSGKSFSPIGACGLIFDYGGDHAFGDLFTEGARKFFNLAEIVSVIWGSHWHLSNVSKLDRFAFHSPPRPLLFLATSTHMRFQFIL